MSEPLSSSGLELRDLSVRYAGPPEVVALRSVDLDIAAGEAVAIVGASGSGKSTLLNVLGLLEAPTAGAYLIDGQDAAQLPDHRRAGLRSRQFGFIFQSFHLLADRTACENVELPLIYQGLRPAERRSKSRDALVRVGLEHRLDAYPATLSGGERQRVAIARALAGGAATLLCDEPTGNLDSENGAAVLDLLLNLNVAGLTLIVVTHDGTLAARLPRRVHVRDGRVEDRAQQR